MTIKAMVPIYDGDKFLGLFEVITKVNSIAKKLSEDNVVPIVLVDKKYKKQLRHAYTNTFVKDYYVANLEVNPKIVEFTKNLDLNKVLNDQNDFQIINGKFLSIYHLKDVHNEEMGYFLLYKNLEDISINDIEFEHIIFVLIWLGIMSIIIFIFFYILNKSYTSNLQQEIDKKTKELRDINENLKMMVAKETEKNRKNETKLFQQEKLLQIAEMFRNIAHHWRQPLSIISTNLSGLNFKLELNQASSEDITRSINDAIIKTDELSSNIEFFSKAYDNNQEKEKIELKDIVENALKVLEPLFLEANIQTIKDYENTDMIINYNKSKFIDMLITILQNSYDSLIQKDIEKVVRISLSKKENNLVLIIEDNGVGIKEDIVNKIFEPYITTKHQSSGVGLSLYFAHNIVVNGLHGSIEASNLENGAQIVIKIPVDQNTLED